MKNNNTNRSKQSIANKNIISSNRLTSTNQNSNNNNINNNQEEENPELEGHFRYTINYCCCCTKLIELQFLLTKNFLIFYSDKEKKKLFLKIPRTSVIAINKRQIDKNDVFKFSIYYQNPGDEEITEIKLKASNKADTDRWISTLRRFIQPKRYIFPYNQNIEKNAEELFPFKDTRKLYLAFCHLEYILVRGRMAEFFDFYVQKIEKEKKNNNDSILFDKKDEKDKFLPKDNKENKDNIEMKDINLNF